MRNLIKTLLFILFLFAWFALTILAFHNYDGIRTTIARFTGDDTHTSEYEVVIERGLVIRSLPDPESKNVGMLPYGARITVNEMIYNQCHFWGNMGNGYVALSTGDLVFAKRVK